MCSRAAYLRTTSGCSPWIRQKSSRRALRSGPNSTSMRVPEGIAGVARYLLIASRITSDLFLMPSNPTLRSSSSKKSSGILNETIGLSPATLLPPKPLREQTSIKCIANVIQLNYNCCFFWHIFPSISIVNYPIATVELKMDGYFGTLQGSS